MSISTARADLLAPPNNLQFPHQQNSKYSWFSLYRTCPNASSRPETTSLTLLILINASVRIPVVLKDIHPSTEPTRKRLDEVTTEAQSTSQGAPGKFYKGQAVADVIKALTCGGSNARVILQEGADASVKESFDRFRSRLKDGDLVSISLLGSNSVVILIPSL